MAALVNRATSPATLDLEVWQATPDSWAWDIRPVQVALEIGRRLLGALLSTLTVDNAQRASAITELITAREKLSQLAWAVSDLADHRAEGAFKPAERAVCGQAMLQFASLMNSLHDKVWPTLLILDGEADTPRQVAIGLTQAEPNTDRTEMIIKRTIAAEVAMHAFGADERSHKVDYTLQTMRPGTDWPPLLGAQHHAPGARLSSARD